MTKIPKEADTYLQTCPHCAAWPMSFIEMEGGAWARELKLRFMCPKCRATEVFPAMRVTRRPATAATDTP